jgi:H+/Cl- antiporter ClcA
MWRTPKVPTSPSRDALTTLPPAPVEDNRPYIFGVIGGAIAGLLGAYFYKRAAEENQVRREKLSPTQMLSVATSMVGILRQIAELGKPPQKK